MGSTLKERLKRVIRKSRRRVFLRDDFAKQGGGYRQMSRVLRELQSEGEVVRAGYGVYLRPSVRDVEKVIKQVTRRLGRRVPRELTIDGITIQMGASSSRPNMQTMQDQRKLTMAKRIVEKFPMAAIRRRSLDNIRRWEGMGVWASAFEEWRDLLTSGSDEQLRGVMMGEDANSNRLRQSAPYTGFLTQEEVESI